MENRCTYVYIERMLAFSIVYFFLFFFFLLSLPSIISLRISRIEYARPAVNGTRLTFTSAAAACVRSPLGIEFVCCIGGKRREKESTESQIRRRASESKANSIRIDTDAGRARHETGRLLFTKRAGFQ